MTAFGWWQLALAAWLVFFAVAWLDVARRASAARRRGAVHAGIATLTFAGALFGTALLQSSRPVIFVVAAIALGLIALSELRRRSRSAAHVIDLVERSEQARPRPDELARRVS